MTCSGFCNLCGKTHDEESSNDTMVEVAIMEEALIEIATIGSEWSKKRALTVLKKLGRDLP